MQSDAEPLSGAIDILLDGMEAMAQVARWWHPDEAAILVESVLPYRQRVAEALAAFEGASWPEDSISLREPCLEAARALLAGYEGFEAVDPLVANRHFRSNTLAQEALYAGALGAPGDQPVLPAARAPG